MFSKNAKKIDEIFTVDLTVTTYCQIDSEDFVNFVAFSENVNFSCAAWNVFFYHKFTIHKLFGRVIEPPNVSPIRKKNVL